jgi:hypothetical protein
MRSIPLTAMQKTLDPFDLVVSPAGAHSAEALEGDIDAADKYDLGRTWRQDWKAELRATIRNSGSTFVAQSSRVDGFALFGVTPLTEDTAQIWLIQSTTFSNSAASVYQSTWPHRGVALARATVNLFTNYYRTLFNFISKRQETNIRWLYASGFRFYQHPLYQSDMLMFSLGHDAERLAADIDTWVSFLGKENPEQ